MIPPSASFCLVTNGIFQREHRKDLRRLVRAAYSWWFEIVVGTLSVFPLDYAELIPIASPPPIHARFVAGNVKQGKGGSSAKTANSDKTKTNKLSWGFFT